MQICKSVKISKKEKQTSFAIFVRQFRKQKAAVFCMFILCIIILLCVLAPFIAPYGISEMDGTNICALPSLKHLFGTDDMGRDIFSRILYGGRYSLVIGVISTIMGAVVGMILGAVAGYFGGWVDNFLMRVTDVLQAIPATLLSIIVAAVLGTGFVNLLWALAVGAIVNYTRMMRASILSIRNVEYIEASRALNCSSLRIIVRHILPNTLTPMIVTATMGVSQQILAAATLAYIGLGVQPPNPEWGAMLSSARDYLRNYPHMLIFPGLMIAITVLCFNMMGDGVRDAMDPKLKN